jgi:excisionase family DNA binding protein
MRTQQEVSELVESGLRTIEEARAFTRLSRSALYGLMERGELPYVKLGRRRLVPQRALLALAERGLVMR